MRRVAILLIVSCFASKGLARPNLVDRPMLTNVTSAEPPLMGSHIAVGDTVYFGGTTWDPIDQRWEALPDSCWTFDTGIASGFSPHVPGLDSLKDSNLHTMMEGWVGWDRSRSTDAVFVRRSTLETNCVGTPGGGSGSWSMYCGLSSDEADSLCYVSASGYGNNWRVSIEKGLTVAGEPGASLSFDISMEVEPDFDFVYSQVDTGDGEYIDLAAYTGTFASSESIPLTPGQNWPSSPSQVRLRFSFESDESVSNEDGEITTTCGGVMIDNVQLVDGPLSDFSDYEAGSNGWSQIQLPGPGGDWSDIASVQDLQLTGENCPCALSDSLLVFTDPSPTGHRDAKDNLAISPWIDLEEHNAEGYAGRFLEFDFYGGSGNYHMIRVMAQFDPDDCPSSNPWIDSGYLTYFGNSPVCGSKARRDISSIVPPDVKQVRVAIGVVSWCDVPVFSQFCTLEYSPGPCLDNIRVGVYGSQGAFLSSVEDERFRDAFPSDGTPDIGSSARVDQIQSWDGFGSSDVDPGDTTTIMSLGEDLEVRVQFAVRPGPGIDNNRLQDWLATHQYEGNRRGLNWYSARMDTAEVAGEPYPGQWMTTYHELDPNFSGQDSDLDCADLTPSGGLQRLANDIFPDDLLTPGSRLGVIFLARSGSGEWITEPDTANGEYFETEVLPSSATIDSTSNSYLYITRATGEDLDLVEAALKEILPAGSANLEETAWDRWDLGGQGIGRVPSGTSGATDVQLGRYSVIIYDTANDSRPAIVEADSTALMGWNRLMLECNEYGFYLSGNKAVSSSLEAGARSGLPFLTAMLGVRAFGYVRSLVAPPVVATCLQPSSAPLTHFIPTPEMLASTPATLSCGSPGYDFNALIPDSGGLYAANELFGIADLDNQGWALSISSDFSSNYNGFRSVVDGAALVQRRDDDCLGRDEIKERLQEVLDWIGGGDQVCGPPDSSLGDSCPDSLMFATIQEAIDASVEGDTIVVPDGLYVGDGNYELNFGKKGLTLISCNGPQSTIIDAQGAGRIAEFSGDDDTTTTVVGITLRGGSEENGALLRIRDQAHLRLIDCVLDSSSATGEAGAVFIEDSGTAFLSGCIIQAVSSGLNGGAISVITGGNAVLEQCSIESAMAGQNGGGLSVNGGTATLLDASIEGCSAQSEGGGIWVSTGQSDLQISGGAVTGCSAASHGGGLYIGDRSTLDSVAVHLNFSGSDGGGLYAADEVDLTGCDFRGNTADDDGGGLSIDGRATLIKVNVTGNRAMDNGGGVHIKNQADVVGTTISGNTSLNEGGGIWTREDVLIQKSIVWGNCGSLGGDIFADGSSVATIQCSIVDLNQVSGDYSWDIASVSTDPQFCAPESCSTAPSIAGAYDLNVNSPGISAMCDTIGAWPASCGQVLDVPSNVQSPGVLVAPNPSYSYVEFDYKIQGSGPITAQVFDVQGRRVWTSQELSRSGRVRWNHQDMTGKRVSSGVYYVKIGGREEFETQRLTVLR